MKSRAWLLYLGGGIAALLGFLLLPHLRQGWVFNLISLSSPIAIVVAVRMWKPNARAPWYLFALGQTFFVIGDVITYNYNDFFGTDLPYPSIGDVAYLLVYPCLVGGLLMLIRQRSPGRDRDSVIDSLIVAIGPGYRGVASHGSLISCPSLSSRRGRSTRHRQRTSPALLLSSTRTKPRNAPRLAMSPI